MGDSLHKLLLDNDSDDEVPQNRQSCRDSHELTNARHVLLQQQVHVNTHLRVSALTGRKVNLHKAVLSLLHMTMLQTMNSIVSWLLSMRLPPLARHQNHQQITPRLLELNSNQLHRPLLAKVTLEYILRCTTSQN